MSVTGEFKRLLSDCRTFLARSSAEDSDWEAALASADARVAESLSEAASAVIALRSGPDALEAPCFRDAADAAAFEALADHLTQICYAIVGR